MLILQTQFRFNSWIKTHIGLNCKFNSITNEYVSFDQFAQFFNFQCLVPLMFYCFFSIFNEMFIFFQIKKLLLSLINERNFSEMKPSALAKILKSERIIY